MKQQPVPCLLAHELLDKPCSRFWLLPAAFKGRNQCSFHVRNRTIITRYRIQFLSLPRRFLRNGPGNFPITTAQWFYKITAIAKDIFAFLNFSTRFFEWWKNIFKRTEYHTSVHETFWLGTDRGVHVYGQRLWLLSEIHYRAINSLPGLLQYGLLFGAIEFTTLSLFLSSPVQILSGYERRGRGQGAIRLDRPAFYLSAIKGNIILFYFFCHQARRATVQASDATRLVNDRLEKDKLPFLLTRTELFQEI